MIYPVLVAAAALAVWTLLPRRKPERPYYLEEEVRVALHPELYDEWDHLPRDGSRGYREKGE